MITMQTKPFGNTKQHLRLISVLTATVMGASGCVTPGVPSLTTQFMSNSANDACRVERGVIVEAADVLGKNVAGGAIAGAVAGGLAGAMLSGRDPIKGALIGAAAGTVLGGGLGYLEGKRKQNTNSDAVVAAIGGDAAADARNIASAATTIRALSECRKKTLDRIQADYSSGAITKQAALQKAEELRALIAADNELISKIAQQADSRRTQYVSAIADERKLELNAVKDAVQAASDAQRPLPIEKVGVKSRTNIRAQPNASAQVVGIMQPGQLADVVERGTWVSLDLNGIKGYVRGDLLINKPSQSQPNKDDRAKIILARLSADSGPSVVDDLDPLVRLTNSSSELSDSARSMDRMLEVTELFINSVKPRS